MELDINGEKEGSAEKERSFATNKGSTNDLIVLLSYSRHLALASYQLMTKKSGQ